MRTRVLVVAGLVTFGILANHALGQQQSRLLHQEIPSPRPEEAATGSTEPERNPDALTAGDKLLPEPPTQPRGQDEPVFGQSGFAADRNTEAALDRATQSDGTLQYVSVFNPDVIPFKRMSALNAVDREFVLQIANGPTTPLNVGGRPSPARDRFWATLVIQLSPERPIAIPSVAPDMRILSYETHPRTALVFSKDSADNYYVAAPGLPRTTQVRVVMSVDADAGYFAPALPSAGQWTPARVRKAAPPGALAVLPPDVHREAVAALDVLGLTPESPLEHAFNTLVAYHRSFQAADPPPDSGNAYRDLFWAQVGVCRHRSFVFMITANALGIPTRYVTNEAHAFVEVWFPQRQWQRIDLGGAALNLEVHNGQDKTIHKPRSEDPFAKPDEYRDNYTQLRGDIRGLDRDQIDERSHAMPSGSDAFGDQVSRRDETTQPAPPTSLAPTARPIDPSKATLRLTLRSDSSRVFRNGTVRVTGTLSASDGTRITNRTVAFYAVVPGEPLDAGHWLGATQATDGTYDHTIVIPPALSIGRYEMYAVTPEDTQFNAAVSE